MSTHYKQALSNQHILPHIIAYSLKPQGTVNTSASKTSLQLPDKNSNLSRGINRSCSGKHNSTPTGIRAYSVLRQNKNSLIATVSAENEHFFSVLSEEIETLWIAKEIPGEVREIYRRLAKVLPKSKAGAIYSREIEGLRRNNSLVQVILQNISTRETIIDNVLVMNEHLSNVINWENLQEVKLECVELLKVLRMITIQIVENIWKWKQGIVYSYKINDGTPIEDMNFMWGGLNYLHKMRNDCDFISMTEFNKILRFSRSSDPFLLAPSIATIDKALPTVKKFLGNLSGECVLPLNAFHRKRIRAAEKILFGDDLYIKDCMTTQSFDMHTKTEYNNPKSRIKSDEGKIYKQISRQLLENCVNIELRGLCIKANEEERGNKDKMIYKQLFEKLLKCLIIDIVHESIKDFDGVLFRIYMMEFIETSTDWEVEVLVKSAIDEEKRNYELAQAVLTDLVNELSPELAVYIESTSISEHQKANKKLNNNTAKTLTESMIDILIHSLSLSMAESCYTEAKEKELQKQENSQLAGLITEDLLKESINTLLLAIILFSQEGIEQGRAETLLINKTNDDLSQAIFSVLLNELIHFTISSLHQHFFQLDQIAEFLCDELINQLLSTELVQEYPVSDLPTATHLELEPPSPKAYSIHSVESVASNRTLPDPLSLDFDYVVPLNEDSSVEPLSTPEDTILLVLEEYYSMIPQSLLQFCHPLELLIQETFQGNDPSWYWFTSEGNIIGLLIYSFKCNSTLGKYINIHHFSTLNLENYKTLLGQCTTQIWATTQSDYIYSDVYTVNEANEIPSFIKRNHGSCGFRWKSTIPIQNYPGHLFILGIERKEKLNSQNVPAVTISSLCQVSSQATAEAPEQSVLQLVNRYSLLHCILSYYNVPPKTHLTFPSELSNGLQEDLCTALELISTTDGFTFAYSTSFSSNSPQEMQNFLKQHYPMSCAPQSVSVLNFNFNWTSCSVFIQELHNSPTYILRFKTLNMTFRKNSTAEVFIFPLDVPNVSAFFIESELRSTETDLFRKVVSTLKGSELAHTALEELCVPAFNSYKEASVPWVKGFSMSFPSSTVPAKCILSCREHLSVNMNLPSPNKGVLSRSQSKGKFLSSSFIFGVLDWTLQDALELPLLACIIEESDWVKAED